MEQAPSYPSAMGSSISGWPHQRYSGGEKMSTKWEYQNLQLKTVSTMGGWSHLSGDDLHSLEGLQNDGWEVFHVVNIQGTGGFTAHLLFMLRRQLVQ